MVREIKNNKDKDIYVETIKEEENGREEKDNLSLTKEDIILLARVIQAEAEGEPMEGKVAIGAVIINRLRSPDFPNTLKEVVMQESQFESVKNGRLQSIDVPNRECLRAAKNAAAGEEPTEGALFFYNPVKSRSKWLKNRRVTKVLGEHEFLV